MAASTLPAPSARRVHPVRSFLVGDEPMPSALWGIIFFIFSEIMFFSGLIAAMLALHADTLHWEPTNGAHRLEGAELRPILFTALLVSTSIPMQIAAFSIRKGNRKTMIWSMAIVLVIGTAFIINQGFEWSHAGFGISDGTYAASFYTLTGLPRRARDRRAGLHLCAVHSRPARAFRRETQHGGGGRDALLALRGVRVAVGDFPVGLLPQLR